MDWFTVKVSAKQGQAWEDSRPVLLFVMLQEYDFLKNCLYIFAFLKNF